MAEHEIEVINLFQIKEQKEKIMEIAAVLLQRYPDDWMSRVGVRALLLTASPVGVLVFFAYGLVDGSLAFALTAAILFFLPIMVWRRVPGIPRWAHRKADLSEVKVALLEMHKRLYQCQRDAVRNVEPSNGMDFWIYAHKVMRAVGVTQAFRNYR